MSGTVLMDPDRRLRVSREQRHQALAFDLAANWMGIVTTNGGAATIGAR